jgi:WD40 repeat protein
LDRLRKEDSSYFNTQLTFSPDGERLGLAVRIGSQGYMIVVWEISSAQGTIVSTVDIPGTGGLFGMTFSPDANHVAVGVTPLVFVWNVATGHMRTLRAHHGYLPVVAFLGDGQHLVTADPAESLLKHWDLGRPDSPLATTAEFQEGQPPDIYGTLAISPDTQRFAAAGAKGSTYIWDANGRKLFNLVGVSQPERWSLDQQLLVFTPDGQRLAQAAALTNPTGMHHGHLIVWDANGKELFALRDYPASFTSVSLHPDGDLLAAVLVSGRNRNGNGDKEEIRVWSMTSRREILSIPLPAVQPGLSPIAFSPNGEQLVTFIDDSLAPALLDSRTGQELRRMEPPGDQTYPWPQTLGFSPSGKLLIADYQSWVGSELVVWEKGTGKRRLSTHASIGATVRAIAWSRDEKRVAITVSSIRQNQVLLWDLTTNQQVLTLNMPEELAGGAVAFGPGDEHLYCVGSAPDSKVRLITWSAPNHASSDNSATNKH